MKRTMILTLVLAIVLMGMGAYAMPIKVSNGTFTATATDTADGSEYALDVEEFQLLGKDADGAYLVYSDGHFLTVSAGFMQPVLDAIGGDASLPVIADMQTLSRGSRGEGVETLQRALIRLGDMSGSADGDFGGMSERAVSAAQEALGLEETGEADAQLQLLLQSMAGTARSYTISEDPAVRFSSIIEKTDANLDKVVEMGLNLVYDDIYGVGMISDGTTITYNVPTVSEIDKRSFTASFGLAVAQGDDGRVSIDPVMKINCTGAQRHTMQEVTLKSGDERHTFVIGSLENSLSGLNAVEDATIALDDDTVKMLAGVAEAGELKIRIVCKYNTYDIVVPTDKLARIAALGEAAVGLKE